MALASPGVLVKEVDYTATVQVADQSIAVVAIDAEKGPTDVVTYISSERELVDIFGRPNDYNYESWFAASTVIQYGGIVAVVRPSGSSDLGLRTASIKRDGTSVGGQFIIKNKDDYEQTSPRTYEWAARTPGNSNNGITVVGVDHGADQQVSFPTDVGSIAAIDNFANAAATGGRSDGTYVITATGGAGSGAKFNVVVDTNGAATITINDDGAGYADNDTLTLPRAGAYGGTTDITVQVDGVQGALPAVGVEIQWADGSNTYRGTVYKVVDGDSLQITLWNSTQRLKVGSVVKNAAGNVTIGTVSSLDQNDVYSTLEYAPNKKWSSLAPQPGTSGYVSARSGAFDEIHIAVIDTDGNVSGVPGSVLEAMTFISKATDAKSSEGVATYWKTYVTENSKYIYPGDADQCFVDTGDQLALAGHAGTASNINSSAQNAAFKLFNFAADTTASSVGYGTGGSVAARKISGGANYDYSTTSAQNAVTNGIISGYDLVKDPEIFGDIDFLVPGTISQTAAAALIAISELRRDCITVVSPERTDVVNSNTSTKKTEDVISFFQTLSSSSYAIFDSGYKYLYDKYNDIYRYVPCAADVAGLCINCTINSETWFSPGGYNRGQLRNATKLAYSPRQSERDRLYSNKVNPIVAFPGQGIVLFGDKTALSSPSAFDRINVRRLFIELEKNIAQFSKYQLFEINDELTRAGFRAAVEPYLRGVQGRRGIYDFLVVCDTSNNTPDVIDRNEFLAEIYIKPARSINYITITFVATRSGVSFNELIT